MGIIGKCQYRRHDWTAFVRKFDCGHAGMAHVKPGAVHRVGDIQHTAHESCAEPLMRKERDLLSIFAGCQISTPASIEHIALFCQKHMGIVPNSLIAAAETGIRQCGILPPLMTQCSHLWSEALRHEKSTWACSPRVGQSIPDRHRLLCTSPVLYFQFQNLRSRFSRESGTV